MKSIVKKYAFTWSPDPKKLELTRVHRGYHAIDNFKSYEFHIKYIFRYLAMCTTDFVMFPELNKQGNIHYHGTLYMTDNQRINFYKNKMKHFRKLGYILVKGRDINQKWTDYQSKDEEMMSEVLNPLPVPLLRSEYLNNNDKVKREKTYLKKYLKKEELKPTLLMILFKQ